MCDDRGFCESSVCLGGIQMRVSVEHVANWFVRDTCNLRDQIVVIPIVFRIDKNRTFICDIDRRIPGITGHEYFYDLITFCNELQM